MTQLIKLPIVNVTTESVELTTNVTLKPIEPSIQVTAKPVKLTTDATTKCVGLLTNVTTEGVEPATHVTTSILDLFLHISAQLVYPGSKVLMNALPDGLGLLGSLLAQDAELLTPCGNLAPQILASLGLFLLSTYDCGRCCREFWANALLRAGARAIHDSGSARASLDGKPVRIWCLIGH
ncbi:hypothetical protein BOTBODRAFT_342465 [Botryobasidium botryosum FD-172 SS1]|uniref:Uncharacterized protein n=1 Tax=Botryobasidium botryosum (strain FD-172 SS1) TaxID=930990 RepID=A0A067MRH1_BOTB1|nr:hypothetical protein BOTBODRAFT_342465 [Botryobasidium botryosum FD-172 SS1]